ncbi:hypothetical protein [Calothrix sp. 336/3]|uniref:hypothetical protein n=1 Tax=Calothrix sp. 336/3 TaxID=1337936 RepID=UPI0004E42B7B|nr:hypothetical protein [Calothrix sp. 336/3]AKG22830.1 hypothetical protein IJ00_17500 [Calothrix sp. 336/3]
MHLSYRQTFATVGVACLCIAGFCGLQLPQMQRLSRSQQNISLEALNTELKHESLRLKFFRKVPAFSFDNLLANWVYLNYLQYFGDDASRDKTGYALSPEYFEIIIKHDPRFLDSYVALSTSTGMFAGMPEKSINLMQQGLKSLSPQVPKRSYYVWRQKGTDELLFLGNSQSAKKSFSQAANWASQHQDEESQQISNMSRSTAEFLERNPNSKFAQIATWAMVLNSSMDSRAKRRAIKAIESLGGKVTPNPDGTNKIKLPQQD